MTELPDFSRLSDAEKDALIRLLWQRLEKLEREVAELRDRLAQPAKTPDNASLPPSQGRKAAVPEKPRREGPRQGSLGRKEGGRPLGCEPDETYIAKPVCCAHCNAPFGEADQMLHGRYDKACPRA